MLFIPALDLINGRCVRLEQGDYTKKTSYSDDPVRVARSFQEQGARYLHIVDLDAAADPDRNNRDVIRRVVESVDVPVQVGGGIRSRDVVRELLDAGVSRLILGTIVVKQPDLARGLAEEFGKRLAAGIDSREGLVRVSGWTEGSAVRGVDLGKKVKAMGFTLIVYTDIGRDGMLAGPDTAGIAQMARETGLPVIAAGGISNMNDIRKIAHIETEGVVGVISGKAIYEGTLSVREAVACLRQRPLTYGNEKREPDVYSE